MTICVGVSLSFPNTYDCQVSVAVAVTQTVFLSFGNEKGRSEPVWETRPIANVDWKVREESKI